MENKKYAFTLAEVLITLGIIGVVAVLTIPTLISNTNSSKYRAQFKKTISTMNQAARMSYAKYNADFSSVSATCTESPKNDTVEDHLTVCGVLNNTLTGATYIGNPFESENYSVGEYADTGNWYAYRLADGSMFAFLEKDGTCTQEDPCHGFIDVNGVTRPNTEITGEIVISYNNINDIFMPPAYAAGPHQCMRACVGGKILNPISCQCVDAPKLTFTVSKSSITDVYPIVFYDHTVAPSTTAGQYVLAN